MSDTRTAREPELPVSGLQRALIRLPIRRIIQWILGAVLLVGMFVGTRATLAEGVFSGEDWRNFVIFGVAQGSLYAIIAVGYTLVYGILFMINFAHGEVFMAGAFGTLFVALELDEAGLLDSSPVLSIAILFASSMTISTLVALVLERVAYRPLRGAPRLIPLITSIGASLFIQYTFLGLFGPSSIAYPEIELLQGEALGGLMNREQL